VCQDIIFPLHIESEIVLFKNYLMMGSCVVEIPFSKQEEIKKTI
jgi:hypothetical protein